MTFPQCSVGLLIPCRDERQNISRLLTHLLSLNIDKYELNRLVVVSDSKDGTDELVRAVARESSLEIILTTDHHPPGKSAAITQGIRFLADVDIVVLISADVLPIENCIERMLWKLGQDGVGVVGAQVVPVNEGRGLSHAVNHFLWDAHHLLALECPKSTEITVFKNSLDRLDIHCSVDELDIEWQLKQQGYRVAYEPEAIVVMQPIRSLGEYMLQRTRVTTGYLRFAKRHGYKMPSLGLRMRLRYFLKTVFLSPGNAAVAPLVALLEGMVYLRSWCQALQVQDEGQWQRISSAKRVFPKDLE